jgi:phage-related baseplate assembly protein
MISPTIIDLASLPAPSVIETLSFDAIVKAARDDLVVRFPLIVGVVDLESEPSRKLIEVFAYREMLIRARVNDAARAVMLAFSQGSDLDQLAALWGVVRMVGEDDARFLKRIQLAPDAFSVAGPDGAYQFHAMTADVTIRDVSTDQPRPGEVVVTVMMSGAEPRPTPDMLSAVYRAVTDNDVRPLTDAVSVVPVTLHRLNLGVILTLYMGPDASVVTGAATTAFNAFFEANRYLGIDLLRQGVVSIARVPGVYSAALTGMDQDIFCGPREAFQVDTLTVSAAVKRHGELA